MGRGLEGDRDIKGIPRRNPFRQEINSPGTESMEKQKKEIAQREHKRKVESNFQARVEMRLQEMLEEYREEHLAQGLDFSVSEKEEDLSRVREELSAQARKSVSDEINEEALLEIQEDGQRRLDERYEYLCLEEGFSKYIAPHILRDGFLQQDFQVIVKEVDDPREREEEGVYRFIIQRDPLSRILAWSELFKEVGANPLEDDPENRQRPRVKQQLNLPDLEANEKQVTLDYLEVMIEASEEEAGVMLRKGYGKTIEEARLLGQKSVGQIIKENLSALREREAKTRAAWEQVAFGERLAKRNSKEVEEAFCDLDLSFSGRTEKKREEEVQRLMESIRRPRREDFSDWQTVTYIRNPSTHYWKFDFPNLDKYKDSEIFLGSIFHQGQEEYIIRVEEDSGAVIMRPTEGSASTAKKIMQTYPYMDTEEIQDSIQALLPRVIEGLKKESEKS